MHDTVLLLIKIRFEITYRHVCHHDKYSVAKIIINTLLSFLKTTAMPIVYSRQIVLLNTINTLFPSPSCSIRKLTSTAMLIVRYLCLSIKKHWDLDLEMADSQSPTVTITRVNINTQFNLNTHNLTYFKLHTKHFIP